MTQQAICPDHGPYDAALGVCPYPHTNAAPRPAKPMSLDEDLPTDFGTREDVSMMPTESHHSEFADGDETEIPHSLREEDVTELEVAMTPIMGLLWIKEGPRRGKYYPIRHGTIIGRKEGSLILDDPKVSSRHAKITQENDDFVIWDLGSSNGTLVNGNKIREATTLAENDLIKIGESVFVIKLLDENPNRTARGGAKKSRRAAG